MALTEPVSTGAPIFVADNTSVMSLGLDFNFNDTSKNNGRNFMNKTWDEILLEYYLKNRKWQKKELDTTLIVANCVYLFALFVNILTNSVTIGIILTTKDLRTRTNTFMISLCASDIIYALGAMVRQIVIITYSFYPFAIDIFLNQMISNFAWGMLMHISNGNLVLVSMERWLFIVHPFWYQRIVSNKVVTISIAVTWVSAFALNLPYVVASRHANIGAYYKVSHAYIYPIMYSTCFVMLVCVYTHISVITYRHLRTISTIRNNVPVKASNDQSRPKITQRSIHSENWKSVKLLITICGLYFLLATPYVIVFAYICVDPKNRSGDFNGYYFIFYTLIAFHHSSNFFVYALQTRQFKNALKKLFRKLCWFRRDPTVFPSNTSSTKTTGTGSAGQISVIPVKT